MSCNICFEKFDEKERRPKILKCGHTYCLQCLLKLCEIATNIQCPEDRTLMRINDPKQLPDNYSLQSLIEDCRLSAPRFFCLDCEEDANSKCMEKHIISSLKNIRLQRNEDRLSSAKKGSGSMILPKLIQQLDLVEKKSCPPKLDVQRSFLADKNSKVQRALGNLYRALEFPGPGWEDALKVLEEESKALAPTMPTLEDALEILNIREPRIRVDCARGRVWSGRLRGSDGQLNLLRSLLFQQRMDCNLARATRAELGEDTPRDKILGLLRDEAFPTYLEEEVLDMSHFHDTYGFADDNNEQLHQLLESKEKVRVLRGLGAYDEAKAGADDKLLVGPSVHHSISLALSRHAHTAEVVYLRSGCLAQLRTALSLPNLRKLDVSYAGWKCRQCGESPAGAPGDAGGVDRSSVQIVVLDVPKEWVDVVRQYGEASLREIVIRKAFLPNSDDFPVNCFDSFCGLTLSGLSRYSSLQCITLLRAKRCPGGRDCSDQLELLTEQFHVTARCGSCLQQSTPY